MVKWRGNKPKVEEICCGKGNAMEGKSCGKGKS
jgi:hypothetical protein